MTIYSEMTKVALSQHTSPQQAWEFAVLEMGRRETGTSSSRAKGCPKAAFVGLAQHGYIRGFAAKSDKPMGKNVLHALWAYRVYLANPSLLRNKTAWWQAVVIESKISRENQAGVLDVVAELIKQRAFLPPAQTAPR